MTQQPDEDPGLERDRAAPAADQATIAGDWHRALRGLHTAGTTYSVADFPHPVRARDVTALLSKEIG